MEVLLTGASGHVGSLLLPALDASGASVRALTRDASRLEGRVPGGTRVVEGDVGDAESLAPALEGVEAAFYLVHSLDASGFSDVDRRSAEMFANVAAAAGVSRIVYLGGLGTGDDLSEHLASRQEVGEILRSGPVPTIEFRASILLGEGSLSFELLRSVVEALVLVPVPNWATNESQPIASEDVVRYLVGALELPPAESRVYEIGGADRLAYLDLLEMYADVRGLSRMFVPVPVFVPALISPTSAPGEWFASLGGKRAHAAAVLVESLQFATVADDEPARRDFGVEPIGAREALERAIYSSA